MAATGIVTVAAVIVTGNITAGSPACGLPVTGGGKQGVFNDWSEVFPQVGLTGPQLELVTITTGIVPAMMPKKV